MSNELANLDSPASVEAEMALLGAVLVSPEIMSDIEAMRLVPDDFFLLKHGQIWAACLDLHKRRMPVDFVTLAQAMDARSELERIGGAAYLTHLLNSTPSSVHAEFYAQIVIRASIRRKAMRASDHIKAWARDESIDTETVISRSLKAISDLVPVDTTRTTTLADAMDERMLMVLDYIDNPTKPRPGLPSSIPSITRVSGGWQPGDLVVFSGLTSEGKSALLFAEMLQAARHGYVGYFSLEMSTEKMSDRAAQLLSGVSVKHDLINVVSPRERDINAYIEAIHEARSWTKNIILEDVFSITPTQFLSKARRMQSEYGCVAYGIDYIQIMTPDKANGQRQQELGSIVKSLKEAAKDLNVPILTAAQMKDRGIGDRKAPPKLADIREAADISMNADFVGMIYRPDYREDADRFGDAGDIQNEEAQLIIGKNRDGARNISLPLWWRPKHVAFADRAEVRGLQPSYIKKGGDW